MEAPTQNSWRQLYPFKSHFVDLQGLRYHYLDEGRGRPLLMVHGNPTWSFYWRNLVLGLRDDYRVLAVDHMGCGLSDKPAEYEYALPQHIANLVSLVDHLDLSQITLLAHDWGGAIGLGAALQRKQRFSRVILFNTAAFPPPFIPLRIRLCRTPLLGTWAIRGANLFARAALWMATERPRRMTEPVKAGLLAPYDSWAHRIAIDRFVRDIPLTQQHPTWSLLDEIERGLVEFANHPVQLIWGMRDWCFRPSCLERFRQILPHAEVHCLADAGHYVVEDAHERIVPLVQEFLSQSEES